MWALQQTTGANNGGWPWLQFHLEPWESGDSAYYGAALAALAIGTAPEDYRSNPGIQEKVALLRGYLRSNYATASAANRIVALWASTKLPGLLKPEQQRAIIDEVLKDQRADGGWRLAPLVWTWRGLNPIPLFSNWLRRDGSLQDNRSDAYATGLIAFVLEQPGIPDEKANLQRALSWLARTQNPEGGWSSWSVNKHRNPSSNTGRFMSDAATAYAVLALTDNKRDLAEMK
jgi:squalene-hopene/tetraprenyl-beta-curcumene cyclase